MDRKRRQTSVHMLLSIMGVVLAFLLLSFVVVGARILQLKDLSLQSLVVLAEWSALDRATKDILTSRSTVTHNEESLLPQLHENLIRQRRVFEHALNQLHGAQSLSDIDRQWSDKIDDAFFVWNYTRRNLIQAETLFGEIIALELVRPLPIGLLQIVYSQGHRDGYRFEEIILLMNFVNQLSILDISSNEFSRVIRELTDGIQTDVSSQVRRVLVLSVLITSIAVFVGVALFLLFKRLKLAEEEQALFQQEHIRHLLSNMFLSDALLQESLKGLQEASLAIEIDEPVAIAVLRVSRNGTNALARAEGPTEVWVLRALDTIGRYAEATLAKMMATQIDEDIILLMNVPSGSVDDLSRYREWVEERIRNTLDRLRREISLICSATIGNPVDLRAAAVGEYARTMNAVPHRFIVGASSVFFADDVIRNEEEQGFMYPFELEHRLGELLKGGNYDDARTLFGDIIDGAMRFGYPALRLTILQVALTITSALSTIEQNLGLTERTDALEITSQLNEAETVYEVREIVCFLIDDLESRTQRHKNDRHERLKSNVSSIIDEHFRDPNLSADTIAEKLGLSASYLGRVFRKQENHSISDAINHRRLNEAARMLVQMKQSVNDIAIAVGVTNYSYFYTLFRKHYGVTPRRFRANHLSRGQSESP